MKRSAPLLSAIVILTAACGPADEVDVQPLPSLEQSSPEARAGLPEVRGVWRFAGWELAQNDSAALAIDLPRFGAIDLQAQKRDSLGGRYVVQAGAAPLYGEVRRDSVISLVGVFGPGDLRYLSGRLAADTVWMELSTLTEQERWPANARAAFVRAQVDSPFVRLRGALPPVAVVDTSALRPQPGAIPPTGTAGVTPSGAAAAPAGGGAPVGATPGTGTPAARPTPTPARPTETPTPARPAPRPTPTPPADEPEEAEVEEEEPPPVPLLGEPALEDTTP